MNVLSRQVSAHQSGCRCFIGVSFSVSLLRRYDFGRVELALLVIMGSSGYVKT